MNEAQTKHDLIEPALREAGWGSVPNSKVLLEFPITNKDKPGLRNYSQLSADYVLVYRNRRIGVIEAKRKEAYYTEGLGQAKDYAQRLQIRYTYATNGVRLYEVDMQEGVEGEVTRYPSPQELWDKTFPPPIEDYKKEIAAWKERLFDIPFETRGGVWQPRYYQENAITKVLEAVAEKKQRILLTLATGTGKTAIAFQIAWKLFHAKWNLRRDGQRHPRILFLADRNILADQAFNSFTAFDQIDENIKVRIRPSQIKKNGQVPKNGSIFFTIFQTFMTDAQKDEYLEEVAEDTVVQKKTAADFNFGQYPRDFFDFIIIDECHRGGANDESSWREIMDYFSPAVQLGLTATPKRDVNADTYEYFGEPVYTYALKEGINDGFLTPFRVKEIQTNYDEYTITEDDTIVEGEAEVGDTFTYRDYGRKIIIKEVEEYRVKTFLEQMNQDQKTLVFCATQRHAAFIRDIINQMATSSNANYCHRVTAADGAMGEQHLRDFQDNEKNIPTVLTTSQKLSTGVDAPEIRNIVLLRPVDSMVEFKQIVGRGTRLFDSKIYFTLFDFVRAHNHFQDPEWDGEPIKPEPYPPGGREDLCKVCQNDPCLCSNDPLPTCTICENDPCVCEKGTKGMVQVTLADRKIIEIDATIKTTFWSAAGKPISSQQFLDLLFADLPIFFKNEEELRAIWSLPSTRKKLLEELEEKGYSESQLEELKKLVHGEDSDLFDVLQYVAYHKDMVPRLQRAEQAKISLHDYHPKQQEFLNFVLEQYVRDGVEELDDQKLPELLELKYHALVDAKRELGDITSIREAFIGFQKYLYGDRVG